MKPNETIDVALPPRDDKTAAFANRTLSIRIQAKQIR